MNKTAIKNFAVWARETLMSEIRLKANGLGIYPDKVGEKLDSSTTDVHFFDIGTGTPVELSGSTLRYRNQLAYHIGEKASQSDYATAYELVMEEVAYTWFNRLVAIRFMEVNDYLPSKIRVLSSETAGKQEPDLVTSPFDAEFDWVDREREEVRQLQNEGGQDPLFRYLFRKQCMELNKILPKLFEPTKKYMDLLLNFSYIAQDSVIYRLVHDIPEEDFREAVEIVGWLYQYYNDERKNEVINIYKGTVKKEDVPAATQLFTTDWVVRYMVDNSLGRYWLERNPSEELQEKLTYFFSPKNNELAKVDETINPEELTFFDPCMGSGHILVYAFDVFIEIYRSRGYSERESVQNILLHNLYGLDIDKRAYQLSYFALMMKARSYDRRFFTRDISPHVYCPVKNEDLENFGSLYQVEELPPEPQEDDFEPLDLLNYTLAERHGNWKFMHLLSKKYTVVVTNPPYLNKMNPDMKKYMTVNYKDYSADLFSIFMYRNFDFCVEDGYSAFMTPFVWMFIKTYEKLRVNILENKSISSLIQMEYSAFEEATVPICSFVLKNGKETSKGLYIRLSDFKGGMEVQKKKVLEALASKECGYFYEAQQENFSKIPGSPIAYWVSDELRSKFSEKSLSSYGDTRRGLQTGEAPRFIRYWYEISVDKFCFPQTKNDTKKWFLLNSGGSYKKWYGNIVDVVNWENNGSEIKSTGKAIIPSENRYFDSLVSWNKVTSGKFSVRFQPENIIPGDASPFFHTTSHDKTILLYAMAVMNSKVIVSVMQILGATINFEVGNIAKLPLILSESKKPQINKLVEENISLSKTDWDSFENSWDFEGHPLI